MNNFIEDNYDEVIKILDTISQTSLELEIIICYQKIDTFIEPASIASKFLIIDEVQDNSIFEFVYTLKYVDKHKESLFIVGDCSQTLYEFRASNPRALNILEGSGTFATYQLNVNYRSNQEILDFANVALQNIEANQYAQIQLQANSLAQVTEQSFLDHVWFNYHQLNKVVDFHQELPGIFSLEIRPYIEKCLSNNEQVAILAFTRRDVAVIKQILEAQYPTSSCVSLVPEKMYNTTVMSSFIKKYWNDIKFAPYGNIVNIIHREIMARLPYLIYNDKKAAPRISKMLAEWASSNGATIQTWVNQVANGQMTEHDMLDLVKDNMIKFEISQNAIKQSLLSAANQQAKKDNAAADADFVISTIHSAKGLEFQNVIVLYRNENQMEEDKKRMYYVALTRAMQSEYILAYDVMVSPQIQADYVTVLEHLHAIAPAANSPIDMLAAKRARNKRVKI
jgi:DNA helicase-2/ATP-dependent DNA helicase PcrA